MGVRNWVARVFWRRAYRQGYEDGYRDATGVAARRLRWRAWVIKALKAEIKRLETNQ